MRYWTFTNKIKKALIGLCALVYFGVGDTYAQLGVLSPYSSLGVGTEVPYTNARNMGMGGIHIGLSGHNNVNPYNPASYCMGVDTLSVMFNIGFHLGLNSLKQTVGDRTLKNQSTGGGLGNLEFYFPVFKWWKMGLYLTPLTDVAYRSSNFRVNDSSMIGSTQLVHQGFGGLSRFGWGNSFGWGPVSVGINLNYVFGNIEEFSSLIFEDDSLASNAASSKVLSMTRLNGLGIDVGLMFSQKIRNGHLSLGAAYSLEANLHSKRSTLAAATYSETDIDTAFFISGQKGIVKLPAKLKVGLSYENYSDWLIGADFTYSWWSQYSDYGKTLDYMKNTYTIAVGAELKHNMQSESPFRKVAYRLGGRYGTYYTDFAGKSMSGYALSIGVGIPIRRSRSMINVGLEYGQAGNIKQGQIREDYFKIGISFSSVETWFVKRKYD